MPWWKWLGVAGLVGVAATGTVVVRAERRRRSYPPEEIRARLHARLAEAGDEVVPLSRIHNTRDADREPRRKSSRLRRT